MIIIIVTAVETSNLTTNTRKFREGDEGMKVVEESKNVCDGNVLL
jgi:hypothetical protein